MIIGGYPSNTDRSEIEISLAAITDGVPGINRVGALGKYGGQGRLFFDDKDSMWDFIKANKGTNFDFDGIIGCLWWTIEKTSEERDVAKKVGSCYVPWWRSSWKRRICSGQRPSSPSMANTREGALCT